MIMYKIHLKPVLIANDSIKLNQMNAYCLTWIFAYHNGIKHTMYLIFKPEINFGDKIAI